MRVKILWLQWAVPYKDFFCQKFKKCNQISIKFCYVVKGMLKLLCGWFMNWLHLLSYFLPHKLSVATKNIRRGKVLLVKQQVKGSYPHGIELLFILGTSLSIGWKPQLGNWAKISCEECHWPISMVRLVKLMVKLALNACQVIRLIQWHILLIIIPDQQDHITFLLGTCLILLPAHQDKKSGKWYDEMISVCDLTL